MKGILLAGGLGTRLYPLTRATSKQLLPVYDKPLIYYSLSVLMLAGIRQVLIISTPRDIPNIQRLFGDGSDLGMSFEYRVQDYPRGIADAFLVGSDFIGRSPVCLVLGDNIFHGQNIVERLERCAATVKGATVFACHVPDPSAFGIVYFGADGEPTRIVEKPTDGGSHWAVTGLYFYGADVCDMVRSLVPSERGELEITDLNRKYLERGLLTVELLGRGTAWLDAGSYDTLLAASQYVQTLERRQGLKVGCIEEIAWRKGFINDRDLENLARNVPNEEFRHYLMDITREGKNSSG